VDPACSVVDADSIVVIESTSSRSSEQDDADVWDDAVDPLVLPGTSPNAVDNVRGDVQGIVAIRHNAVDLFSSC